jgi:hypothetical protein
MTKQLDKSQLYRLSRFAPEDLVRLPHKISAYAEVIHGMPQLHSEVFKKRGWLLPFLFTYDDLLWGRWQYWTDIHQKGTIIGSGLIPQIEWVDIDSKRDRCN